VCLSKTGQGDAAYFFFAFQHVFQVDAGRTTDAAICLIGLDMCKDLALVIADTSAVNSSFSDLRLVGRTVPLPTIALWLYIIMTVNQNCGPAGDLCSLTIYDWVSAV
jgi:hypothetical protein